MIYDGGWLFLLIVNEAFELDRLDEMKFRDLLKFAEEKVCTKFTATVFTVFVLHSLIQTL